MELKCFCFRNNYDNIKYVKKCIRSPRISLSSIVFFLKCLRFLGLNVLCSNLVFFFFLRNHWKMSVKGTNGNPISYLSLLFSICKYFSSVLPVLLILWCLLVLIKTYHVCYEALSQPFPSQPST